ncbi:hypothetical protein LROSL1_1196 [Furfurilactobacillus rossiae]|uniref:hypothetical protein n=1 Tax=Furfurilactobacillus rossiae TaxID=231049 RepID=UPI0015BA5B73|nr:hypothetical protein [Furfurilactobacillus rossiae]QLE64013.1 hypothetical protein LROSL1_1196 [Furfurilactobacillus rossiae]
MPINVNIDDQLALVFSFRIANKLRDVTFDDSMASQLERTQLKVGKIIQKVDKDDNDELDAMTVDDQLKYVNARYGEVRRVLIDFFDQAFGSGAGKEIYAHYHNSSRALVEVFGKVYSYLNKINIKDAKAKQYADVNNHANSFERA